MAGHWHKSGTAASPASPLAAAEPKDGGKTLAAKMDAVIDAARKADRTDNELAALGDAKTKLSGLVAAKADRAQLASAASDIAKSEIDILARAEKRLWRDVDMGTADAPAGPDVTKLQQSKSDLDAKLAAGLPQDAGQIMDNLRASLASFGVFQEAYTAATPTYVTARRKSFDVLHAATQSLCDQVAALANVEKPWFLASSARKNSYQLRQDNAAQAKTLSARLNDLAKMTATSADLHQLAAAASEAATAKKTAGGLYAASNAAQL